MGFYLIKNKDGRYSPCYDEDHEASKKIANGTVVKATSPRNYKFHRKIFALFNIAYENQDKVKSLEVYRKIILLKAGFYDEVQDKNGKPYFIPQSLSFDSMSAEVFDKVYSAVLDVVAQEMDTAPEKIKQQIDGFY